MPAQTANKADLAHDKWPLSEADRLESLRRSVQMIVDAKRRGDITEEEALSRIAKLRRESNSIFESWFSRRA